LTPDAFAHLPNLRDRVRPAQQSELRITTEALALWDERARQLGQPADWRLSDQELDASRQAVLGAHDAGEDLWIYSYGSLMWDPGFHFAEVRLADLAGFQRRFSYRARIGRGTPESPGLMLSLEQAAGCCRGLAFRVTADVAHAELAIVWRREMIRGGYCPTLLPVSTPQGDVTALVFAANLAHPDHVGEQPLDQTAAIIASASGVLGTNREYLEQMVEQLDALCIVDVYLRELLAQVRRVAGA
jgi:cation transport protein ChaC